MNRKLFLLPLIVALHSSVNAATVTIVDFPHPELTELESSDGAYHLVSDVKGIRPPLSATEKGMSELIFVVNGINYAVSRADVVLKNEVLVVDACNTVPVVLAGDSRSASVKGAGEGCR